MNKELIFNKSIFFIKLSAKEKTKNFYEIFFNWLTNKLTQGKIKSNLFYKNNFFMNNLEHFSITYDLLNDSYSSEQYIKYLVFRCIL